VSGKFLPKFPSHIPNIPDTNWRGGSLRLIFLAHQIAHYKWLTASFTEPKGPHA